MNTSYFLGANTKDGFYSLYDGFASGEGDFLHIIKGGPGTGKSSFMRRIGAYAQDHGLDVQYVLCSGDPDSLDGVYIPAIKTAWVDGTSPHPIEPRHFGVDSDYIDLGYFCKTPISLSDSEKIRRLTKDYKSFYSRAYSLLSSASELRQSYSQSFFGIEENKVISKRIKGILDRQKLDQSRTSNLPKRIFLTAASCQGLVRLNTTLSELCGQIYQFDNEFGGADGALKEAASAAQSRSTEVIVCPDPIDPGRLDAVLLPEYSLAFIGGGWEVDNVRHIRLDKLIPAANSRGFRTELREGKKLENKLKSKAFEHLKSAKVLHDELESFYKSVMDFDALTNYTEEVLKKLFQ